MDNLSTDKWYDLCYSKNCTMRRRPAMLRMGTIRPFFRHLYACIGGRAIAQWCDLCTVFSTGCQLCTDLCTFFELYIRFPQVIHNLLHNCINAQLSITYPQALYSSLDVWTQYHTVLLWYSSCYAGADAGTLFNCAAW